MARNLETYLGDGAYAYLAEYGDIILYTSNGITETNRVVLGPYEMQAFSEWIKQVEEFRKGPETASDPNES